jgi:hypothetical protein
MGRESVAKYKSEMSSGEGVNSPVFKFPYSELP